MPGDPKYFSDCPQLVNNSTSFRQGAPRIASDSANSPSVFSVCYDVREVASPTVNKVPMTELRRTFCESEINISPWINEK